MRLLQCYFWYKITENVIIICNSSDGLSMFQKPGGLFLSSPPFLFFFFPLSKQMFPLVEHDLHY